jgi:16S rRNA (guanine527-N7)-methyltransferase
MGISLSAGQISQFGAYLEQLQTWNRATNLTSITNPDDIVTKHFIDSIAALQAEDIKLGASFLDIGSGAGFPGIPLKIVRPDLRMTLLEPAPKKASFLHFMIGHLQLTTTHVLSETIEELAAQTPSRSYDYVTSRALRIDIILDKSSCLLGNVGRVILYTSKPLDRSVLRYPWSILKEQAFDLPGGKGYRAISVLQASG